MRVLYISLFENPFMLIFLNKKNLNIPSCQFTTLVEEGVLGENFLQFL